MAIFNVIKTSRDLNLYKRPLMPNCINKGLYFSFQIKGSKLPRVLLLTMLVFISKGNCQIISENIIFNKIAEVGVSRSTWKINYILQLSSYQLLFKNCNNYLKNLHQASIKVQTLCVRKFMGDKDPTVPLGVIHISADAR